MTTDPQRLLDTVEPGPEYDLLRSALSEAPADELRANVLRAVSGALATSAALSLAAGAAQVIQDAAAGGSAAGGSTVGGSAGLSATSHAGVSLVASSGGAGAQALGLTAKLVGLVEVVGGVKLGVTLAMAVAAGSAGWGVVHGTVLLSRSARPASVQEGAASNAARAVGASEPGAPLVPPSSAAAEVAAPAASAPSATPPLGPSPAPAATSTAAARPLRAPPSHVKARAAGERRANASEPAPAGEPLAAQLDLVRRAQRSVLDGKPEAALRLLDAYEQRYGRGVLGPEVDLLRREARAKSAAPTAPVQPAPAPPARVPR